MGGSGQMTLTDTALAPTLVSTEPPFLDECPDGVLLVGRSEAMREMLRSVRLVATSRCNPVLVVGETGTGKELAARAIHALRKGGRGEFVAVNCATLTATLLESELFGHVKGAFTGADANKTGLFEAAGDGTLFLDEISEMPQALQAKLLRVLQEKTFRKVGDTRNLPCRATIIATSNRDLAAECRQGRFRTDLYYRLSVFPIEIAPLRSPARQEDIPRLAAHFTREMAQALDKRLLGLTDTALQRLLGHDWPGNVRELRNVIERAAIVEEGEAITPESLMLTPRAAVLPDAGETALPVPEDDFSLATAERIFITRALRETGWQRTRAAALLGITRATLHAKLKRYQIQVPDSPTSSSAARAGA